MRDCRSWRDAWSVDVDHTSSCGQSQFRCKTVSPGYNGDLATGRTERGRCLGEASVTRSDCDLRETLGHVLVVDDVQ
jgi:hypothetical protein